MNTHLKTSLLSFCSKPIVLVLSIFLLGAAIFLPTLDYDFVWDDLVLIKNNPQITSLKNLPRFLLSDFHIAQDSTLYRPLVLFSFSLDYALFQENPWGFHLTNILLHGLNSALVAFLTFLLWQKPWAALISGAFFALHPAHPEAVAFVSSRTDLLATLFSLLTLIFLLKGLEKKHSLGYLLLTPLFYLLALLAKETVAVLLIPMAILLYQKSQKEQKNLGEIGLKLLPPALMLGLFWFLRYLALNITLLSRAKPNLFYYPALLPELFVRYLLFSLLPPQRALYLYSKKGPYPLDLSFFAFLALALCLLGATLYFCLRRRETVFFFTLFIIPCLPTLIYSLFNDIIMIERYLYLPSVGLALLVGWCLLLFPEEKRKWVYVGLGIILAGYLGATLWRTPLWKNNIVLYESLKKEYPQTPYVRGALGLAYMSENRVSEAYEELSLALALAPQDARYHFAYAHLCLRMGLTEQAKMEFNEALIRQPDYALAWEGLALTYFKEGNLDRASFYLDKAILADPKNERTQKYKQMVLSLKSSQKTVGPRE